MNRKLLKLTALLLILAVALASSCKQKEPKPQELKQEEPVINYPIEVPFTELELETQCKWINLNYPWPIYDAELTIVNPEFIIINNDEELKDYINCSNGNYPEIDFSKHTLLLVNGHTTNCINKISKHLLQLSIDKYKLDIEIILDDTTHGHPWVVALIVNKINKRSNVELNVTLIRGLP